MQNKFNNYLLEPKQIPATQHFIDLQQFLEKAQDGNSDSPLISPPSPLSRPPPHPTTHTHRISPGEMIKDCRVKVDFYSKNCLIFMVFTA